MNSKQRMNRSVAFAAALLLGGPLFAQPQTIIHWGGDYVGGSANFNMAGAVTDSGTTRTWGPANITPTTGYTAPTGKTGPVFAALEHTANTLANFGSSRVANNDVNDQLNFQAVSGATSSNLKGLVYFTKANFLNGMDSSPIELTSMTGSLNVVEQSATAAEYRFAVFNGGTWYLSESTATSTGAFTNADFGDLNWASWSMPVSSSFATAPSTYDVEGSTLTDVQAVGFYFDVSRGNGQARVSFQNFEVIAIPEPGTLALVGIALGSLLLFCRKK